MKKPIFLLVLSNLIAVASCTTILTPEYTSVSFLLTNVNVIDVRTGAISTNQFVAIDEGRIVAVGPMATHSYFISAQRFEGQGGFVIPGLWDAHVHLIQENLKFSTEIVAPLLVSYGITHVRDMGSSIAARRKYLAWSEKGGTIAPESISPGPTIWGIELPYGDKRRQRIAQEADQIADLVSDARAEPVDFLKIYAGMNREELKILAEIADGQIALAGHVQPDSDFEMLAELGFTSVEHVEFATFQGCGSEASTFFDRVIAARFGSSNENLLDIYIEFRESIDSDLCGDILSRASNYGVAFTPTLVTGFLAPEDVSEEAFAMMPEDIASSCDLYKDQFEGATRDTIDEYLAVGTSLTEMVHHAGIPILAGTDSPTFCSSPGDSLAHELKRLRASGLSLLEVLQSTTLLPSQILMPSSSIGAIEPGFDAHLVLLRENPLVSVTAYSNVHRVYHQNRWFDPLDLRESVKSRFESEGAEDHEERLNSE